MPTPLIPTQHAAPAPGALIDVSRLLAAYHEDRPDPGVAAQRVSFGTSGHRGSAFDRSFNEWHILAITQAICSYRRAQGIAGPVYLGADTHALSAPALLTALEVLAGNGVDVMLAEGDEFTPTPAISHAILTHNRTLAADATARADGIVVTPSHNPPRDGGFKYNPPHGGPAEQAVTNWIEAEANRLLEAGLNGLRRLPQAQALAAGTTHRHDFLGRYVADLDQVIDLAAIRESGLRLGVDPMGGAGVHYWRRIAELHRLDLRVINDTVDPTFAFMPLDWDGKIRMDPSSTLAMQHLIAQKDRFDIAFACDTDHDRHGIVTRADGLLPPNHYLAAAIDYLFQHRPGWSAGAAVGKTVVSSSLIDRLARRLQRPLVDVPAGFKWFAQGLHGGTLGFAGEESAGATFLRRDGSAWTTDKDGLIAGLLAAEMTARSGQDPGRHYAALAAEFGTPIEQRVQAAASAEQRKRLSRLDAKAILSQTLAGEAIEQILSRAPGNDEPIGGIKVSTANGWFAARPSGTEDIYKIYAESFQGAAHLQRIVDEAQVIVDAAIAAPAA